MWELGASPFCYIVSVIPNSLPEEVIRGEQFVLIVLLKLIPGSSSQAGSVEEPQAETAQETSANFSRPDAIAFGQTRFLACPPDEKEKEEEGQYIVTSVGLEGFVDGVDPNASDLAEEREDNMSSLIAGFSLQMCKWAATAQGKLSLAVKYLAEITQIGLAQMKRLKRD